MNKILGVILLSQLSGCAMLNAMDPCQTTNYVGATPQERAAQAPRYCGRGGYSSNNSVAYYTQDYRTGRVIGVTTLGYYDPTVRYYDKPVDVYGSIKVDEHGKILNWNQIK